MHSLSSFFLGFLWVLTALPLAAQQAASRKVMLDVCCLRYAGDIRQLTLKGGPEAGPSEVPFYQGGFTTPVPALVENGHIIIYKKGAEGEAPWVRNWSFAVPSAGTSLSVILLPGAPKDDPAAPYTAIPLPPVAQFPFGSVHGVNLTPLKVRLDLGSKKLSLLPGASDTAPLQDEVDSFHMVPVTAWIETEAKWQTLHTTQWSYNPRYRQVALIWMDPTVKRPEITSIRHVRPQPTAAE